MSEWGPTTRLRVGVRLADGEQIAGELHLQPRVSHHNGPETPLDLLSRREPFFPMVFPDESVRFIGKAQVAMVICDPMPPESELDRLGITQFVEMEVGLVDGTVCRGRAGVTLPPTRHRPIDCLNAPGEFLVLWNDGAAMYINRACIRTARPLE